MSIKLNNTQPLQLLLYKWFKAGVKQSADSLLLWQTSLKQRESQTTGSLERQEAY